MANNVNISVARDNLYVIGQLENTFSVFFVEM